MKIVKTSFFERKEQKYLKKLNPRQKEEYLERIGTFESHYPDAAATRDLRVHALTGDKNGKYAFTCLKDKDRDDRVVFRHLGDVLEMEELDVSLEDVGSHDEVYG